MTDHADKLNTSNQSPEARQTREGTLPLSHIHAEAWTHARRAGKGAGVRRVTGPPEGGGYLEVARSRSTCRAI